MANINIGVNFSGGPSGPSGPGGAPQGGGSPKPGTTSTPGSNAGKAAADAAEKLAAAQREATKATGKAYSPAQMKIAADYFKEMSRSRTLLKSYNGDLERFIRDFRNNQPSASHGNRQFNNYMQQMGLGGVSQPGGGIGGIGGMVSQAVRGIFRATGAGGGVAGGIMHQSYNNARESDGGMGSAGGLGMLGKGAGIAALAYAGIKAVQKVGQQVGEAQDEAIGYHDLREKIGGAAVGFEELRASVKHFSLGLGTTNEQQLKLAKAYTESSQAYGSSDAIGRGVGQGTQLSRGFGLDPEAGVSFLATMKHFKASDGSDKDNRKLAYLIGDAVGKTGAFSKADDVMNAIAHFAESTSRQSFQVANIEGYAGMMGSLGGMKSPGMDARGAAGIMSQVAASWGNPGGGGDASKAGRMAWMQSLGLSAPDMAAVNAAGPHATMQSTFGTGSPMYDTASSEKRKRLDALLASAGGNKDRQFLDLEIEKLRSTGVNEEFMPHTIAATYGLNDPQSRYLLAAQKDKGFGNLRNDVSASLVDGKRFESISPQQMGKLAMASYGTADDRMAMAAEARKYSGANALTGAESAMLKKAEASKDQEQIKKALINIEANRETVDAGKEARDAQVNLDNRFKDFAAKVIPLTTMIQEGVFRLVDLIPGGTTDEMKRLKAEAVAANPEVKEANRKRLERSKLGFGEGLSEEDKITMSPTMSQAEKRAARDSLGGKSPRNLRNNNPGNIEYGAFAKSHGATGSDGRFAIFPDKETGSGAMDALLQRYSKKNGLNTVSGIIGKWAPSSENNSAAYIKAVAKKLGVSPDQELNMHDPKVVSALASQISAHEGSADAYTDKSLPAAARPPGTTGQFGKLGGSLDLNINYPDGRRETKEASLSGTFGQTYAGRGGRA